MRSIIYIVLTTVAAGLTMQSCVKKNERSLRGEARDLFLKSSGIAKAYLDSMAYATDSSTLLSLCERYDDTITRLNYEYKAGADYEMSEGENDTLTNLTFRFISLRDSLLQRYANPTKIDPDSTTRDSIKITSPHG